MAACVAAVDQAVPTLARALDGSTRCPLPMRAAEHALSVTATKVIAATQRACRPERRPSETRWWLGRAGFTGSRASVGSTHGNPVRTPRPSRARVTTYARHSRCDEGPWSWVTSRTFRKTVATGEAGFTPRQLADQLGHANPSMTLDVYFGRRVVSADAASSIGDRSRSPNTERSQTKSRLSRRRCHRSFDRLDSVGRCVPRRAVHARETGRLDAPPPGNVAAGELAPDLYRGLPSEHFDVPRGEPAAAVQLTQQRLGQRYGPRKPCGECAWHWPARHPVPVENLRHLPVGIERVDHRDRLVLAACRRAADRDAVFVQAGVHQGRSSRQPFGDLGDGELSLGVQAAQLIGRKPGAVFTVEPPSCADRNSGTFQSCPDNVLGTPTVAAISRRVSRWSTYMPRMLSMSWGSISCRARGRGRPAPRAAGAWPAATRTVRMAACEYPEERARSRIEAPAAYCVTR